MARPRRPYPVHRATVPIRLETWKQLTELADMMGTGPSKLLAELVDMLGPSLGEFVQLAEVMKEQQRQQAAAQVAAMMGGLAERATAAQQKAEELAAEPWPESSEDQAERKAG